MDRKVFEEYDAKLEELVGWLKNYQLSSISPKVSFTGMTRLSGLIKPRRRKLTKDQQYDKMVKVSWLLDSLLDDIPRYRSMVDSKGLWSKDPKLVLDSEVIRFSEIMSFGYRELFNVFDIDVAGLRFIASSRIPKGIGTQNEADLKAVALLVKDIPSVDLPDAFFDLYVAFREVQGTYPVMSGRYAEELSVYESRMKSIKKIVMELLRHYGYSEDIHNHYSASLELLYIEATYAKISSML